MSTFKISLSNSRAHSTELSAGWTSQPQDPLIGTWWCVPVPFQPGSSCFRFHPHRFLERYVVTAGLRTSERVVVAACHLLLVFLPRGQRFRNLPLQLCGGLLLLLFGTVRTFTVGVHETARCVGVSFTCALCSAPVLRLEVLFSGLVLPCPGAWRLLAWTACLRPRFFDSIFQSFSGKFYFSHCILILSFFFV